MSSSSFFVLRSCSVPFVSWFSFVCLPFFFSPRLTTCLGYSSVINANLRNWERSRSIVLGHFFVESLTKSNGWPRPVYTPPLHLFVCLFSPAGHREYKRDERRNQDNAHRVSRNARSISTGLTFADGRVIEPVPSLSRPSSGDLLPLCWMSPPVVCPGEMVDSFLFFVFFSLVYLHLLIWFDFFPFGIELRSNLLVQGRVYSTTPG